MIELGEKGMEWFESEFCGPCTCKNCNGSDERAAICIEAEKLRILKRVSDAGVIDVRTE